MKTATNISKSIKPNPNKKFKESHIKSIHTRKYKGKNMKTDTSISKSIKPNPNKKFKESHIKSTHTRKYGGLSNNRNMPHRSYDEIVACDEKIAQIRNDKTLSQTEKNRAIKHYQRKKKAETHSMKGKKTRRTNYRR